MSLENLSPGRTVLPTEEADRPLSDARSEAAAAPTAVPASTGNQAKREEIRPCDFRQPAFLTSNELRRVRSRHEEFARSLSGRLANYLRLEVEIQLAKLQTILYHQFTENLANPTILTLFKAEPLRGTCLLDMPPRLGLTMVDRLLGGSAQSVNASRGLSEIEIALHDEIVRLVLGEWCALWRKSTELRPTIIGQENNARFLQTATHDTVMLCVAMEVRVGDSLETLQLAFPYFTVESLVRQLGQSNQQESPANPANQARIAWNHNFDDVKAQVTAQWHGLKLTAGQLGNLKPGDIIPLEPESVSAVQVSVGNLPKFRARLGTLGNHWAVELLDQTPKIV